MTSKARVARRPKQVVVGPWTYNIEFMSDKEWLDAGENPDWGGVSAHQETRIRLRMTPTVSEDTLRETLLHEVLHCVWAATQLNHFRPRKRDYEEQIVAMMSPTLLRVLSDNPAVLAYLVNLNAPA